MDLLKILKESKYPKRATSNEDEYDTDKTSFKLSNKVTDERDIKIITNLLTKISKAITNQLHYVECTHIYTDYIKIMSGAYFEHTDELNEYNSELVTQYIGNNNRELNTDKYKTYCDQQIDFILQILQTPYMIYPTFHQLDYYTVVKTVSAPVINFLITHHRKSVHGNFISPCDQIGHDIIFHSNQTHFRFLHLAFREQLPLNIERQRKSYYRIMQQPSFSPDQSKMLITVYENILHPFINTFKSYTIIPSRKLNIEIKQSEDGQYNLEETTNNNFIIGCLFILLHENPVIIDILDDMDILIEKKIIITDAKVFAEYLLEKLKETMKNDRDSFIQSLVGQALDTFNFEDYNPNDYDDERLDEDIATMLANTFLEKLTQILLPTLTPNEQAGGKLKSKSKYNKNKATKHNRKSNKKSKKTKTKHY